MSGAYEFNKVAMAFLLVGTATLGGTILANEVIFYPQKPKKPGYEVAVAAPGGAAPAAAAATAARPIAEVMAAANAANGPAVFRQCASCHTIEKGGPSRVGPNLWGVVERAKAAVAGFTYSAAARAKSNETWSFAALNAYIENPRGYLPGTTMAFSGIRSEQQRADLLAYLREQADTKVDLPK